MATSDYLFNERALALFDASAVDVGAFKSAYAQLPPTKQRFVDSFVATDKPLDAFIMVFPQYANQKPKAYPRVFDLMRDPLIQAAIVQRQTEIAGKIEITAEKVLQEIAALAFSSQKHYLALNADGQPVPGNWHDLTDAQWAALSEVTIEEYTEGRGDSAREVKRIKYKTHDKAAALDKLMKRLDLYAPERVEISGPNGGPIKSMNVNVTMSVEQAAEMYARTLEE